MSITGERCGECGGVGTWPYGRGEKPRPWHERGLRATHKPVVARALRSQDGHP